ncbi:hypothetical protein [Devosia sp.]|uniref:hypothetical protein n=1 Tax=Devosia sp. TaxID=1871048 RepID=UPI00326467DA
MLKNTFVALAFIGLIAAAPAVAMASSNSSVITATELATYCDQGNATGDVNLDMGNGKIVAITVHCDGPGMKVSSNSDNESEQGASEAAENGQED